MSDTAPSETAAPREDAFFKARGFGLSVGFGERAVLLVVDFVNGFTDPASLLGADLAAEIAQTNRLIDAAHARDVPVILTTIVYEDKDLRDAGIWAKKQKGPAMMRPGTQAIELDARLVRGPDDALLVKKYASCFFGTDLVSRLQTLRADTVIIVGCTTSGCVRATAVDACQYGFRPIVPREAVGDRSRAAHEQSLFDLHSRYADVVSVEETLSYFGSLSPMVNA
jgi:nicotinamidase-related amidase